MSVPRNRPIILPVARGPFDYVEGQQKWSAGQHGTLSDFTAPTTRSRRRQSEFNRTMTNPPTSSAE